MRRTLFFGLLLTVCLVATSCGNRGARYHVAGKVTFDGKPIPAGKIYFHSNVPLGNAGPPAFAEIQEGVYDTRKGGNGGQGGPVLAAIEGFDGKPSATDPLGQPLFPTYRSEERRVGKECRSRMSTYQE